MSGSSSQADDYVIMNVYVMIVMWFLSVTGHDLSSTLHALYDDLSAFSS